MNAPLAPLLLQRKVILQLFIVCSVIPLCLFIAQPIMAAFDWSQIKFAWREISAPQWTASLLATGISFAALGRYDVIIHKVLNTGVATRAAHASGAASVALSQTLGFGLIVGTIARWRGLQSLGIVAAGSVTALVSISFMGSWLFLFALAGLAAPAALPLPQMVFKACLFSAICFILYTALKRYMTLAGHRRRFPSLRALFKLLIFAAIDTSAAALAFWLLMPQGFETPFLPFFLIYLTCLGAALIGNTPGGLGPFEVTLLWALPLEDMNDVLAALIAFRVIYFALPACAAILYLIKPFSDRKNASTLGTYASGLHPETPAGLQSGALLNTHSGQLIGAIARTTQTTTLLFEPAARINETLTALTAKADKTETGALLYKCHQRTAARLRHHGYSVARIAQDGIISVADFDLSKPAYRRLRRKLRQAHKAGIKVEQVTLTKEIFQRMSELDADWQSSNGQARGFSMGRFCEQYLGSQILFGAWQNGRLIGFITAHQSPERWTLDLMRCEPNAAQGTMYALVNHAIGAAKADHCEHFSLASTSFEGLAILRLIDRLNFSWPSGNAGLKQFKQSFAPEWQPLYAAAPRKCALYFALWDVWHEIHDPPPLR